jgi:hypothetical protein
VGIFGKQIETLYAARAAQTLPQPPAPALAITSPWSPQDALVTWAVDQDLAAKIEGSQVVMTREKALRVPGVKRAHGIHVTDFAQVPFFQMRDAERTKDQPKWLTSSRSGIAPYQRMYGLGSDFFFYGWGCLSFTADMTDCLHVPYGLWEIQDDGTVWIDPEKVPAEYRARPVAIPLGFGENGLLQDGADTLREARAIEDAYQKRLEDPVPLTILNIPHEAWVGMQPEERRQYRDQWVEGRRKSSTALKVAEWSVDMPGQVAVDLYESGRNAVRLDIANHTSTPASILEGVHQGGGGTANIKYTGVANGGERSELWDYGLGKRMMLAFEARMSLDDICEPGLSIRGDRSNFIAVPTPATNPTSED